VTTGAAAYGARVSTIAPHRRTLWEEGRHPGRAVAGAAGLVLFTVAGLDALTFDSVTVATDVVFVLLCVAAALAVRPRDFFVIGVCPPLLMVGAFAALALLTRGALADRSDGFLQTLISGLAHHATALVVGYALTLVVLALRQVALRHAGVIRGAARPVRR
jgi:Domain of unknown function (DUF6542)